MGLRKGKCMNEILFLNEGHNSTELFSVIHEIRNFGAIQKRMKSFGDELVGQYLITGRKLPSENKYKLAIVKGITLSDDAQKKINSFEKQYDIEFDPNNLEYDDLVYKVVLENSAKLEISNAEVDHFVDRVPK